MARHASATPPPGANQALVNDLLPLLESATQPRGRGQSAVRALLQAFNTEQRRLQTLPVTFARMMKYSDYRNRIPADATSLVVHQADVEQRPCVTLNGERFPYLQSRREIAVLISVPTVLERRP